MKTSIKSISRMFKKHKTRFLSLFLIVLVCVGFISGFGMASDEIDNSLTDYYQAQNISDYIIKSTSQEGFSDEDVEKIRQLFPDATVETGASLDVNVGEKRSLRLQFVQTDSQVNKPYMPAGNGKLEGNNAWAEMSDEVIEGYSLGEKVTLDFKEILVAVSEQNGTTLDDQTLAMLDMLQPTEVTVTGIVQSPLHFVTTGDPSYNNTDATEMPDTADAVEDMDLLQNVLYLSVDVIPTYKDVVPALPDSMNKPLIGTTDIYVALADRDSFDALSDSYQAMTEKDAEKIKSTLNCEVITLFENYSIKSLAAYSEKLLKLGYVVMAAFLLVSALVAFSTMTRLLEEERSQIACMLTLGYSSIQIIFKYMLFAFTATLAGSAGAHFVGTGICVLVYNVFGSNFVMPPMSPVIMPTFYFIAAIAIVGGTLFVTNVSGLKMTRSRPADLLRPKAPKPGKKVILEKIPFIWKRLSFKYKSTTRNVLRYASRFLMTVVSIAFSTGLVLAGLALLDMSLFRFSNSQAIVGISVVIIVFAGLLTAVVIYTLTNISVSERNREIATLMVLGYRDNEVTGYIFREVYINTTVGVIFGYPVGAVLIKLLYTAMGSGTVSDVSWFMWLAALPVAYLFTFLVTIALRPRILKIDMNDSLKAIE